MYIKTKMNITDVQNIIKTHYSGESTRIQYENDVKGVLKLLETSNVYDIYNQIDIVYEKVKNKLNVNRLSRLFSHLKCIMEKMADDQRKNINQNITSKLTEYATKKFHKNKNIDVKANEVSEEDDDDDEDESVLSTNDNNELLILQHKVKELQSVINQNNDKLIAYQKQTQEELAVLREYIIQIIANPDPNQAARNIAVVAISKSFNRS